MDVPVNMDNFILIDDAAVINIKKGKAIVTDKTLYRGSVIQGKVKTKVITEDKEKVPYKMLQIKDTNDFISPNSVNMYIGDFANLEGEKNKKDDTPVHKTSFGQKKNKRKETKKKILLNYAFPLVGGGVGYLIASKLEFNTTKKIVVVIASIMFGLLPKLVHKRKFKNKKL